MAAGLAAAAIFLAAPTRARAQSVEPDPVGRFTGIVGMTLIGFELVFDVELAVGLRNGIILGVSSVVGAAGAGVGGYFIEKALYNARGGYPAGPGPVAVVLLCVGMAGVVPTIIAWKNTSFAKKTKGTTVVEEPKKDEGAGSGDAAPAPAPEPPPAGSRGLVSVVPGGVFVGPPAVMTASSFGPLEAEAVGAAAAARLARTDETRVTLLRVDF